jgi:hypothetical protein
MNNLINESFDIVIKNGKKKKGKFYKQETYLIKINTIQVEAGARKTHKDTGQLLVTVWFRLNTQI